MKFLLLCVWAGKQIKENSQNSCHLKTISQNNKKSNQQILGINMNIPTKYDVSITIYVGKRATQSMKKNLSSKTVSQNDLIFNVHILGAYMHIHIKYEVSILNPVAWRTVHRCQ